MYKTIVLEDVGHWRITLRWILKEVIWILGKGGGSWSCLSILNCAYFSDLQEYGQWRNIRDFCAIPSTTHTIRSLAAGLQMHNPYFATAACICHWRVITWYELQVKFAMKRKGGPLTPSRFLRRQLAEGSWSQLNKQRWIGNASEN